MPPVETTEKLSIPDDIPRNASANSNVSVRSSSFDRSGMSSASTSSSRNSVTPEESALFRMFHENSINIQNMFESSNSNSRYQRVAIPREQSLLDMLSHISNSEDVYTLKEVKLRVVASTVSLSRIGLYCPGIRILKLDGSVLTSLRDIGTSLKHLKVLHVSRCGLTSLDGTFGLTTLQELYANDNNIDHLGPCAALQYIKIIKLERNRISSFNTISFLSICPKLIELSLTDNSICRRGSYRESIIEMLPNIRILDGKALLHNPEATEIEDTKSETDSLSCSIDVSSLTEPNSEDCQQAEDDDFESGSIQTFDIQDSNTLENEMSKSAKGVIRPATSSGIGSRRPFSRIVILPPRPNTANPASNGATQNNSSETVFEDELDTTPSILTSGSIVCGSIGRALARTRSARKRYTDDNESQNNDINSHRDDKIGTLWSLRNSQKNNEFLFCSLPTKLKTKKDFDIRNPRIEAVNKLLKEPLPEKPVESAPVVELEFGVTGMNCEESNELQNVPSPKEALKAAKMWRKAFKLYRTQNNINLTRNSNQEEAVSTNISLPCSSSTRQIDSTHEISNEFMQEFNTVLSDNEPD